MPPEEYTFEVRKTADADTGEVFLAATRSVCPECGRMVDAARLIRDRKVFLRKQCPDHGPSEALASEDADWFLRSLSCTKPGQIPWAHATRVEQGCPEDCGLCPDHEQHTCLPIIEVTDHCDMQCPICLVQNSHSYHMAPHEFESVVEALVAHEGTLDNVNISGGEPTVHPKFLELIDIACRPEIARVSVSTNGLRISRDRDLCRELAQRNIYVSLQLDTLDDSKLRLLRGYDNLGSVKMKALENLEQEGVRHSIVCTVVRGITDSQIGECVKLLLERDSLLSLMFQPAAYIGKGFDFSPSSPIDRVTIPDVLRRIEEQTDGALRVTDFKPMPCSHPTCFALTYLLKTDSGYVPFPRFVETDRYLDLITNSGIMKPDRKLEDTMRDTIDLIWSSAGQIPDSKKILGALRNAIHMIYPNDRPIGFEERIHMGEGLVKTIFVHGFMDRFSFDLERVRKCCHHYALADGRLIPACVYNVLRRPASASNMQISRDKNVRHK